MFTISKPEFDPNTYLGRFKEFQKIGNPFYAFYTNKKIDEMRRQLKLQEEKELE